ncbi:MAG: YggS family pyridoxal phosphate-dependent enzyme [Gloeomargarita sp. GMQP_bins_25]
MTPEEQLAQNWERLRLQIPPQVRVVAVTKQVPVELIRQAYYLGLRDFGENRIQEAIPKIQALQDLPGITWHFIGHLQRNKARLALEYFPWIHSVDDLALAQRLDRLNAQLHQPAQLLLQVKLRPDPHKYGWQVPDLLQAIPALQQLQHVALKGLMTIAPLGLSPTELQALFRELVALGQQLCDRLPIQEYSMGMSDDYPYAIAAGATMVRLGRCLFGERPTAPAGYPLKNL